MAEREQLITRLQAFTKHNDSDVSTIKDDARRHQNTNDDTDDQKTRPEPEGRDAKTDSELARLRRRLVDVEEDYTQELLAAEQREQQLMARVEASERLAVELREREARLVSSLR